MRRRGVGKIAGWTRGWQTCAVVPADRNVRIVGQPHRLPAGEAPALHVSFFCRAHSQMRRYFRMRTADAGMIVM
jgi:hypothetical protein